jgi:amicyanin
MMNGKLTAASLSLLILAVPAATQADQSGSAVTHPVQEQGGYGAPIYAYGYGYPSGGYPQEAPAQAATAATANRPATVAISGMRFEPQLLRIGAGTTVTWQQLDGMPHTVTAKSSGQGFSSGTLNRGQTYRLTFPHPGSYDYHCALHPNMAGRIVVE